MFVEPANKEFVLDDIGSVLREARMKNSLSQQDIANATTLPVRFIEAIENNEFKKLPGPAYARGYIKNYARIVKVDAQPLLQSFNKMGFSEPSVVNVRKRIKEYDGIIVWSTIAVVTISVGILVNGWINSTRDNERAQQELVASNEVKSEPSVSSVESAAPATSVGQTTDVASGSEPGANRPTEVVVQSSTSTALPENTISMSSTTDSAVTANSVPVVQPSAIVTNKAASNTAQDSETIDVARQTALNGPDRLQLIFNEESWAEIKDANDVSLLRGLVGSGVIKDLHGAAPFSVFLGNSPGVILELNGRSFDQTKHNRSNNTARFEAIDTATYN